MAERRPNPLFELTRARLLGFFREPGAVFWVFGFPILLAIVLGLAFREQGPAKPRIAVIGEAPAIADIDLISMDPIDAARALRTGKVSVVVDLTTDPPTYTYDPTRPEAPAARAMLDDALQRTRGRADVFTAHEAKVSERGSRYIDFLIPGLIGLNVMGSSIWSTGYAIVTMRSRKLLKRLAATPMRRADFLASFLLARLVFLFTEVAVILLFGRLAFGVQVEGSYVAVAIVATLGAASFAGIGLLTGSRTSNIEVAGGLANVAMMPMWLVSGAFFAYERFPAFLQPVIRCLPLTALNDALRAIFNDGATLVSLWRHLAVLIAWGVVSFVAALRLFRWQ